MFSFSIVTFGCKVNYAESEVLKKDIMSLGLKDVALSQRPDLVLINSCSVTNSADNECLKTIRRIIKNNPTVKIIISGCFAKFHKDLVDSEHIIAVFDNHEKQQVLHFLKDLLSGKELLHSTSCDKYQFYHAYSFMCRARAFLKIQDGCNYWCSYCIIPQTRGCSRSDSIESIINDVREIRDAGSKEIVLTGINIGDVGLINNKREYTFNDLLKAIDKESSVPRIRISSLEPNFINDEFLEIFKSSKNIVKHLHIPLQSGNDGILRLMRRRYDTAFYRDKIMRIKSISPLCCIGVDVIVGFPGETEQAFDDTYRFLQELPVAYLHVFPFSVRVNTVAASMEGQVPERLKYQRVKKLRMLSDEKKGVFYKENIGTVVEVLFEEEKKCEKMYGYSGNYLRIEAPYDATLVKNIVSVKVEEITNECLAHVANISILA